MKIFIESLEVVSGIQL